MKLIHAADIHLDSPMVGLARYDGAPEKDLKGATRKALTNLVDAAIDNEVAALLLAGDLFDGDWTHFGTGVHFVGEMGRLREAGIPVVSISGNHDAASKITKELRLPDNVHVLNVKEPQTFVLEDVGIAVHGQGYATAAVKEDLSLAYPEPDPDLFNVGLLHTAVGGRRGHANYAPCSLASLREKGYDYFGLGHSHAFEVLSEDPPVVFSGNLQGRNIRERGPKGAVLVEASAGGTTFERLILDVVRWDVVEIDTTSSTTLGDVAGLARGALREAAEQAGDRLLAARVALRGFGEIHHRLLADPERLRHEIYGAAVDVAGDGIWVEDVRVETSLAGPAAAIDSGAVGELRAELDEITADDDALIEIGAELGSLEEILPRSLADELSLTDPRFVSKVLRDLSVSLPEKLLGGDRR
jgi:DNA repair protein SbcD/Mre11